MNKFIAIAFIAISANIFAQDQVAKKILDRLSTTTKSYANISINFDLIIENESQKIKEKQQGTLIIEAEKFKLIMDDQTIICNGETKWIYLADMNEVQIIKNDEDNDMISPNKLFTIYEKDYNYSYIGNESKKGKTLQIINLFPKESRDIMKMNIAVDALKNQLERITIYDKNGGTYSYLVKSFESNIIVKPFIFNINNYPNIEVIDLR
jgi:outer membrane lipoprotein-sorting protein